VSNAKLCYFPNCCSLVFCDEHINFQLIAICSGGSWSTTVRQIGDVPVAIFEVSPVAHCWHPYKNLHRQDKVNQSHFQQNFSPLQGIQLQHNAK
jgi:hypothetical protein